MGFDREKRLAGDPKRHGRAGYEGTALLLQLEELRRHLTGLLRAAEQARPADKALWDHALDGVQAIGKAVVGLGVAVKEIAFMARDLGMWGLDAIEQLQAAKQTGEAVYLAVSDAIGAERKRLMEMLELHGLEEVDVITFPEGKLRDAAARLRKGLGIGAGLALVTADDLAEHTDE